MRVFKAMLIDAYRELNSKKLFWVVLAISGIIVLFYGSIGFGDSGMSLFFGLWNIESEFLTADSPISRVLYRSIFSTFIVGLWLAWVAIILALISTTTVFPDYMASGAIDIVLAKPIRRITLFAIKYITSLLFVLLQVGLFCVGVFLCLGLRLGDWEWKIFLAIPLITLLFSYLFSINVLVGVRTRSALAALLITLLVWFSLFGVNLAEGILTTFHTQWVTDIETADERIATLDEQLASDAPAATRLGFQQERVSVVDQRTAHQEALDRLNPWRNFVRGVQFVAPKTSGSVDLLNKVLIDEGDVPLMDILEGNVARDADGNLRPASTNRERDRMQRMQEEYNQRTTWWYIVGTSLLFELVVLALAAWIFVRRDY